MLLICVVLLPVSDGDPGHVLQGPACPAPVGPDVQPLARRQEAGRSQEECQHPPHHHPHHHCSLPADHWHWRVEPSPAPRHAPATTNNAPTLGGVWRLEAACLQIMSLFIVSWRQLPMFPMCIGFKSINMHFVFHSAVNGAQGDAGKHVSSVKRCSEWRVKYLDKEKVEPTCLNKLLWYLFI